MTALGSSVTWAYVTGHWVPTFACLCVQAQHLSCSTLLVSQHIQRENSPFQQPRPSPHTQYQAARCPLKHGDPSWAGLEVLGLLCKAAGATLICILPLYSATHLCAGEGKGFGEIFSYNTSEISPLISMPGRTPFSRHLLVLSFARRLRVSPSPCTELPFSSRPALVSGFSLPRGVISSKSCLVLPPVTQVWCDGPSLSASSALGSAAVSFGDIGSCFYLSQLCPQLVSLRSASIWMQSRPRVTLRKLRKPLILAKEQHSYSGQLVWAEL